MKTQETVEKNFNSTLQAWEAARNLKLNNIEKQIALLFQKKNNIDKEINRLMTEQDRIQDLTAPKPPSFEERSVQSQTDKIQNPCSSESDEQSSLEPSKVDWLKKS